GQQRDQHRQGEGEDQGPLPGGGGERADHPVHDVARGAGVDAGHQVADQGAERRADRSEEHTSELQSRFDLVCRLLLEKKKWREYYNVNGIKRNFISGNPLRCGIRRGEVVEHRCENWEEILKLDAHVGGWIDGGAVYEE